MQLQFQPVEKSSPAGAARAKSLGSTWGDRGAPHLPGFGVQPEPPGTKSCPSWGRNLIQQQDFTCLPKCGMSGLQPPLKTGHLGESSGSPLLNLGGCCNGVPRPTPIWVPTRPMCWLSKALRTRNLCPLWLFSFISFSFPCSLLNNLLWLRLLGLGCRGGGMFCFVKR